VGSYAVSFAGGSRLAVAYPKVELHVHLEGTVRPETLLAIARRNDVSLPARSVGELRELYRYRDFAHFLEVWYLTTQVLRTGEDFRQVVVLPPSPHGEVRAGKTSSAAIATVLKRHASGLVLRYA
jgi:adenosine/AMP deaminase-like protein